jgi:hypothetical protein
MHLPDIASKSQASTGNLRISETSVLDTHLTFSSHPQGGAELRAPLCHLHARTWFLEPPSHHCVPH